MTPTPSSERFSDAYLLLRERVLRPSAGFVRDAPVLSEKALRAFWYERRFPAKGLRAEDGRPLAVLRPGEWNLGPGPDFVGAEIELAGGVLRGDVEVHISGRDWDRHGHRDDPAFDNVVLHVFMEGGARPFVARTRAGASVPALRLALPGLRKALGGFDAAGYPYASACGRGACGGTANAGDPRFLEKLLRLAGEGRALIKARRDADSPLEEIFYRGLMAAMGYHKNKAPAEALARRLPLDILTAAARGEGGVERIEALLLGEAGLLDEEDPACRLWRKLWERLRPSGPSPDGAGWTLQGLRPVNFPHRRLSGAARLLRRFLEREDFFPAAAVPADFLVPAEGPFARLARWGGRAFARPVALIGPDRAQALWVNAYLPLALRRARAGGDADAEARLHRAYAALPLREPNSAARLMAHRLLGSERGRAFRIRGERAQQGLIQIFQDFCDTKPWACQACVFPLLMGSSLEGGSGG